MQYWCVIRILFKLTTGFHFILICFYIANNVLNFNENQLKLIDIDTNLLNDEPKFSENELQILKEIHDVMIN